MKNKKTTLADSLRYMIIALPLLFLAPVIITVGFKALKKDDNYLILILGIFLAFTAIIITAVGLIRITRYIFDRDKSNEN